MCEEGTEDRTGLRLWTGLRAAHVSWRRLSKYQLHMDVGKCPRGPTNSSAGSLAPGAKADSLLHCIRNSMMVSTLIVLLLSREENLKNEKDMLVEVNPPFFFLGGEVVLEERQAELNSLLFFRNSFKGYFVLYLRPGLLPCSVVEIQPPEHDAAWCDFSNYPQNSKLGARGACPLACHQFPLTLTVSRSLNIWTKAFLPEVYVCVQRNFLRKEKTAFSSSSCPVLWN